MIRTTLICAAILALTACAPPAPRDPTQPGNRPTDLSSYDATTSFRHNPETWEINFQEHWAVKGTTVIRGLDDRYSIEVCYTDDAGTSVVSCTKPGSKRSRRVARAYDRLK